MQLEVFRDKRGNFHLLTNINNGHTRCDPSVPCGGHAWSRDGLTWSNLTIGAFGPNQNLANGSVWKNAYVERPQVVQDKAGNPLALFLGMSKLDGYADSVSWSSKFCAPGQDRSECGPTTACEKGKKGCGCSDVPNPPGSCPLPPAPPPAPPPVPPVPPGPPAPLPPAATLVQFRWSDGRCLTIEPATCKADHSSPCPLVLGSCAGNASHWAERQPHMTHGATNPNAIDIDCTRQEVGAVVKLLGSSPSSIIWKKGHLEAGGTRFCLNNGEGRPIPPCGPDKALPTQIKLVACANVSATGGWTRVVVSDATFLPIPPAGLKADDEAAKTYLPVPEFLDHFTPALHVPTHHGKTADGMQDPAGNIQLADGTYHVFPCCKWEHFASTDLVHWETVGPTNLGGGTGSMAVRDDGSVIAMAMAGGGWHGGGGANLHVASDRADCAGPKCLSDWKEVGPVLESPKTPSGAWLYARVGDPARPWKARDGLWYQLVGASVKGKAGHGALYRAHNATLEGFTYMGSVISENQTIGFGKNRGFFDMMECPDFFPLGPPMADGSQKHVFISSAYLQSGSPEYTADGYHNAVTFWLGTWAPPDADGKGGQLEIESTGAVDWGQTVYYSSKSLTGAAATENETTRLLGGWVMDSNGESEPKLCKNGDSSDNGAAWVICPEAFHREISVCKNTTTSKTTLCQRPAPQLAAMRQGKPVMVKIATCEQAINHSTKLPITGLQLELHANVSLCKGHETDGGVSGEVGVGVLESAGGSERTRIGYNLASRTLFVDRSRSSKLPAAKLGGGVLASGKQGYGQRSREFAPLPEVTAGGGADDDGSIEIVVLIDHSILTVFANDAVVITTRVYTAGGNSSGGVSFFAEGLEGVGVRGSVSAWALSL